MASLIARLLSHVLACAIFVAIGWFIGHWFGAFADDDA